MPSDDPAPTKPIVAGLPYFLSDSSFPVPECRGNDSDHFYSTSAPYSSAAIANLLVPISKFCLSVVDIPSLIYPDNLIEPNFSFETPLSQPSDMIKPPSDSIEPKPLAEPPDVTRPSDADLKPPNDPSQPGPPSKPPGNLAEPDPTTKPPGDLAQPEPPAEPPPFHAPYLTDLDCIAIQDLNLEDILKTWSKSKDKGFTHAAGRSSTLAHQHQWMTQAIQASCHAPLHSDPDREAIRDFNLGRSRARRVQHRCPRLA
jgi:hypothetical protein